MSENNKSQKNNGISKLSNQIVHNTVRIVTFSNGKAIGGGTGFIYGFSHDKEKGTSIFFIVTNKHVIKNAELCKVCLNSVCDDDKPDVNMRFEFEIKTLDWIMHPDDKIDICICPIGGWISAIRQQGKDVHFLAIDESRIPSETELDEMNYIEDVIVVGYPNLIWDDKNNIPVIRKGITATPLQINYLGEPKFLVDAAIYPGSSGSPVFILNEGMFNNGSGTFIGSRLKFIGIIHRVYQHTVTGEIIPVDIPTDLKTVPMTNIPNNLGIAIKSSVLRDFEPILKELIDRIEIHHHE